MLRSRAKPIRFAAAGTPTPSGGSVGVGGPAPLSIEDLTSIYQVVHRTEAGEDPFEDDQIQHLRGPLEEYLSLQPERHEALLEQPRIVSDPEDASIEFDLLVVPAEPDRKIGEVKIRLKTQILFSEVPHYRFLALEFNDLSSMGELGDTKLGLLKLLEYEIRYLRGSNIVWTGCRMPPQRAAAGPC